MRRMGRRDKEEREEKNGGMEGKVKENDVKWKEDQDNEGKEEGQQEQEGEAGRKGKKDMESMKKKWKEIQKENETAIAR